MIFLAILLYFIFISARFVSIQLLFHILILMFLCCVQFHLFFKQISLLLSILSFLNSESLYSLCTLKVSYIKCVFVVCRSCVCVFLCVNQFKLIPKRTQIGH